MLYSLYFIQLIESRMLEVVSLVKKAHHSEIENLSKKVQSHERELNFLRAEVENLRTRNQFLETKSNAFNAELENLRSRN